METKPRRSWLNIIIAILLPITIGINIWGLHLSSNNAEQAKILATQNQKIASDAQASTITAREQNIERQEQLKSYIKCIVLLKFEPTLTVNSPEVDVAAALDKCAINKT